MAHHSPFMTVAGAGKARGMVSTEQLSTLDPFHLGFWPAPPRAFFCLYGKLLRKNTVAHHAHDIVTAFPTVPTHHARTLARTLFFRPL